MKRLADCERNHISREQLEAPAYLEIASTPAARIHIDGVDSELTTPIVGRALELKPGRHKVTFVVGDLHYTHYVTIRAGVVEKLLKHWP